MEDAIYYILQAAICIIAAILARYIVSWIKSKLTASQLEDIAYWVKVAVWFIEQTMKDAKGPEKKEEAVKFVKGVLGKMSINLSDEQVNALIESTVREMNLQKSE